MIDKHDFKHILDHVDFTPLYHKRILITGASGFIGSWLRAVPPELNLWCANRINYNLALTGEYDYIIHLAHAPVVPVISCALRSKATVLYASSGAVYDDPVTDLGIAKMQSERELLNSGLTVKIARLYSFTGAHIDLERFAIGAFIKAAMAGYSLPCWGKGGLTRSYMYAADMAIWMWNILINGEGVYNVGSDVPVTIVQAAREIAKHFDPPPQVIQDHKNHVDPRPYYVPDITRAKVELGLQVWVDFEQAIAKTVKDYKYA